MSEILMSLAVIILASLLVYSKAINLNPLSFEPHEKLSKRNKWLIFIEIRCLLTCINACSQLFFAENSTILFAFLFDMITYGVLLYLLVTQKKSAFTFMYFMVPFETFIMVLNANIANETTEFTFIFTAIYILIWLLPNYIYFMKRRTLFEQVNRNKISEDIINETIDDMKKDLALALQHGDTELARVISQRISNATMLNNVKIPDIPSKNKSNFKLIISEVCIALSTFLGAILSIGATVFYVYTLYVYFTDYGFWQGFISMFLPVLSTIWLCIQKLIEEGIDNTVTTIGLLWLGVFALTLILYGLGTYLNSQLEDER